MLRAVRVLLDSSISLRLSRFSPLALLARVSSSSASLDRIAPRHLKHTHTQYTFGLLAVRSECESLCITFTSIQWLYSECTLSRPEIYGWLGGLCACVCTTNKQHTHKTRLHNHIFRPCIRAEHRMVWCVEWLRACASHIAKRQTRITQTQSQQSHDYSHPTESHTHK